LQALRTELARYVFMEIEQPESSPKVPPEGDDFQTIGQFYKAIELHGSSRDRCSRLD
jgi:hypothetical protein